MDILSFAVIAMATYRLSHLMVYEDAPLGIARRFRELLKADRETCEGQRMAQLITNPLCCFNCTSIWVSLALVLLFRLDVIYVFALSGAAMWLHER